MRSTTLTTVLLAALGAHAIKVTSPTKNQVIDASSGFKVTFDTVSSDPTSAHVFLVNMAGGGEPFSKDLGEVDLTTGSFTISEGDFPAQQGYQINIQSVDEDNTGILAQSQQFAIKEGKEEDEETSSSATGSQSVTSSVTVTSSASSTLSSGAVVSGSSTLATVSGSGTAVASAGNSTASSSSVSEAAAPTGQVVAGGSLLALAVAGLVAVIA